jgi:hypothetical protein
VTTDAHPDELLAEYVDGALDEERRSRVEAHLSRCDRCREEVALAGEGRLSLAALPPVEAPSGLALEVRRAARTTAPRAGVWRVAVPVAAAAALIVGAIVVIGSLTQEEQPAIRAPAGGGQPSPPEAAGGPFAGEAADEATRQQLAAELPFYRETNAEYVAADLAGIARELRDDAGRAIAEGMPPTAASFYQVFEVASLEPRLREVYRCVVAEVPPEQLIVPFTIEAALFEGRPAYIASFLQGPAPTEPYDRLVMWVVARDDCTLQSLASQRL